MRHSQRCDIICVKLTCVGASIGLGHVDNDQVGAHEADPVVLLDMHGNRAYTGSEHPGPMLPDEDKWPEVGDLEEVEHGILKK